MDRELTMKMAISQFNIITMAYTMLRRKRKRKSMKQKTTGRKSKVNRGNNSTERPVTPVTRSAPQHSTESRKHPIGSPLNETQPQDNESHCSSFGMTIAQFENLHRKVGPYIGQFSVSRHFRKPLSTKERLRMALRYLVGGVHLADLAASYSVDIGAFRETVFDVGSSIWRSLQPTMLPVPKEANFQAIAKQFLDRWHFPNCIGAIGARQFTLYPPPYTGEVVGQNIVLMAVVDASHKFRLVDIGEEECYDEDDIFENSNFEQAFDSSLKLPKATSLPGSDVKLPYALVGDSIFSLKPYLMRPFAGQYLPDIEAIFNHRLSTCRQVVDNAYGVLSSRWKVFQQPIKMSTDTARVIVKAAVCLHNYLMEDEMYLPSQQRRYCPTSYVDLLNSEGVMEPGEWRKNAEAMAHTKLVHSAGTSPPAGPANTQRVALAEYFMTTGGQVIWQRTSH